MGNILTHSSRRSFFSCARKYEYAYVMGIRRTEDEQPLRMGDATHIGAELYHNGMPMKEVVEIIYERYADKYKPISGVDDVHSYNIERVTVGCLLMGYEWRWKQMDSEIKTLKTEWKFDGKIINPDTGHPIRTHKLSGKVDRVVQLPTGEGAICELKTCRQDIGVDSDYVKRLRLNGQISIYFDAADKEESFPEMKYILFDIIRKPDIRPKKIPVLDENDKKIVQDEAGDRVLLKSGQPRQAGDSKLGYTLVTRPETPEEFSDRLMADIAGRPEHYYARIEVPRLKADIEESRLEIFQAARMIHESAKHNRWPRNDDSCITFSKCPYFSLCTGGYDPETMTLPEEFKVISNIHPELEVEENDDATETA